MNSSDLWFGEDFLFISQLTTGAGHAS